MQQKTEPLSDTIVEWMEAQRSWVKSHYPAELEHLYDAVDGKLKVIEAILKHGWADEDWKQEAIGVTMGDLLVQQMGMKWVIEDGAFGKSVAVEMPASDQGKCVFAYPIGMLQKRMERGEVFDIRELFAATCKTLEERAKND